jgi:nitrous oxide reductase
MTTVLIILAIALLAAVAGLAVEIGIASWNIRRADRYRRRAAAAEHTVEREVSQRQELAGRMESLDEYASKVSWLLNFLYKRYDKFADLEKEVNEGLKGITGDTPIGEARDRYNDLKKALKIVRAIVRVSERVGNLMESVASQAGQIMEDLQEEEEDGEESEFEEPAEEKEEPLKPESAE